MIESLVLKNTVLDTTININKTTGEYWLNEVDFGQAEGDIHSFKFIDQIGQTVYNITFGSRQITITGWVAAWHYEQVQAMKKVLNEFVNPLHLLEVYANGKKIQFYPRTSIRYSPSYKQNNEVLSNFLITGYCPYPLFTDENEHEVLVSYTEKLFHFPLIIPADEGIMMGIRQPTLIAQVENTGNVPIGYIIEFRAYGDVINPSLTDIGSQQYIKLNKKIVSGEIVTIDTREGYRHITGNLNGIESNYFKYRDYKSNWLSLARGMNYLRYNADGGVTALEVAIRFEPGFLEIDA